MSLRERFDIDDSSEAPEVCAVEREQAANAVFEHRRDDIGVMDLTTAATMGSEEVKEAIEYTR